MTRKILDLRFDFLQEDVILSLLNIRCFVGETGLINRHLVRKRMSAFLDDCRLSICFIDQQEFIL